MNFIMDRLLGYKGVDFKIVINQIQEILVILYKIHAEGMVLVKAFHLLVLLRSYVYVEWL